MTFNKDYYLSLVLLVIPFLFLFLFGRYGLEDSDSGFISGLGWRILNGEVPYRDFYYVRPIVSPLLSSFWMFMLPDYGQVFFTRLITYYQLMIQVVLTVFTIKKYYDFKSLNINPYVLILVSFFITSTGTLYFQWHTTDGILLAVIGFFLVAYFNKRSMIALVFAGAFFGFSALTKQNFMLVPLLALVFTFLQHGFKCSVLVLIGIASTFFAFYYYLDVNNLIQLFLMQNTGSTTLKDLFTAGFISYFVGNNYVLAQLLLTASIFIIIDKLQLLKSNKSGALFLAFLVSIAITNSLGFIFNDGLLISFDKIFSIAVVASFVYLFIVRKENISQHYLLIALLGVSWASSISWGGMSPIMFFTPLVFSSYYLLQKYFRVFDKKISVLTVILITTYSCFFNLKPYRDGFVWTITEDASVISEKLAFIKSNPDTLKKHLELKGIFEKYNNSTILPSMPGAYYIHSQTNKLSIDWAMDVEVAFDKQGLIDDTDNCCSFYILEKKHFGQPIGESGKFYSSVADYVLDEYKLLDSNYEYFDIYIKN